MLKTAAKLKGERRKKPAPAPKMNISPRPNNDRECFRRNSINIWPGLYFSESTSRSKKSLNIYPPAHNRASEQTYSGSTRLLNR